MFNLVKEIQQIKLFLVFFVVSPEGKEDY